mmetsp:Transcript_24433/g.51151  ORF Transcript_24433/g.51151 Transcript_24433/m.51151 type:complete len:219 (-) Transcript_24433:706-1362(-)
MHLSTLFEDARCVYVEVQVAVAQVAEAGDERAVRLEPHAHLLDERVELGQRDGDVVLVNGAALGQRLCDALAHLPDALRLGRVLRDGAVGDRAALHHVLQESAQLLAVMRLVGARELDQHVMAAVALERRAHAVRRHQLERLRVEKLDGGEHLAEVALGGAERLEHRLERVAAEEGKLHRRRRTRQRHGHARDYTERALRADEELLDVVARVVLAQSR